MKLASKFFKAVRKAIRFKSTSSRNQKHSRRALFLEGLENRQVMAAGDLLISEYMANSAPAPDNPDVNREYVEFVATREIDFGATPYSVIWTKNGSATTAGWKAGEEITYGFNILSGHVFPGDVVYVGGSAMAPNPPSSPVGTWLRVHNHIGGLDVFNNMEMSDDGLGRKVLEASVEGVLGNGDSHADGIAVFDLPLASVTNSTKPIDAIFFGTGTGNAYVSGSAGYRLPQNDRYNGDTINYLQDGNTPSTQNFLAPNPVEGQATIASGVYSPSTNTFPTARTWTNGTGTDNATLITLVSPEVNVQGLGVDIADGDATPSTLDDTLFPPIPIGNSAVHIFTIQNLGTGPMVLSSPASTNADFVISGFPSSIAPSSSATFNVTFSPTAVSPSISSTISFINNDSNEDPYNFVLTGSSLAAPAIESVGINAGVSELSAAQRSQIVSLTVTFNNSVTLDPGAFSIENTGLLSANAPGSVLVDPNFIMYTPGTGSVFVITFDAGAGTNGSVAGGVVRRAGVNGTSKGDSLADGNYVLTVDASKVHQVDGQSITNNQFGDDYYGDKFFRMFGDNDGDGDVDGTDTVKFRQALTAYNAAFDWDGGGAVLNGTADSTNFSANNGKKRRLVVVAN